MKYVFHEWSEVRFRRGEKAAMIEEMTLDGPIVSWLDANDLRAKIRKEGEDRELVKALHQYGIREKFTRGVGQ